ncbi:MAG: GNAT family N-acetyltransferase [Candidatus Nanopelagicaceae bacterium]|jgi:GNAT superfamily N-acetyltransferase
MAIALKIHKLNQENLDEVCEFLSAEYWKIRAQDLRDDWHWPTLVGIVDNEIVAFLSGTFNEPFSEEWCTADQRGDQAWIFDLLIGKDFRRMGYGAEMVRSFCYEAKSHSCTHVALDVDRREPTAIREAFFAGMGFRWVEFKSRYIVVAKISEVIPD